MERQSEPALGTILGSFGNFVSGHFDIYDQALHHRTIFTNMIIRWADVVEVRFGKVTYNTLIPSTFVDVKVRDRFGQKVSVSDYVMRIANVGLACRTDPDEKPSAASPRRAPQTRRRRNTFIRSDPFRLTSDHDQGHVPVQDHSVRVSIGLGGKPRTPLYLQGG